MPIPPNSDHIWFADNLERLVRDYNTGTGGEAFNASYATFIENRERGIARQGSLSAWLATDAASMAVWGLLDSFGMNIRNSRLISVDMGFSDSLASLQTIANLDGLNSIPFPTGGLNATVFPSVLSVADELILLYDYCCSSARFSNSGGFVIASKVLHCVLPNLAPMIDGLHSGISYYNFSRASYFPPGGDWTTYLGFQIDGLTNPSPRGAGRNNWRAHQFCCSIGYNETLYNTWQTRNGNPGLAAFMALDPTPGTTTINRIIDKGLW